MPIHAWSKTDAGLFHHFHQRWIGNLCDGLNGVLPPGYFALSEQVTAGPSRTSSRSSEAAGPRRLLVPRITVEFASPLRLPAPGSVRRPARAPMYLTTWNGGPAEFQEAVLEDSCCSGERMVRLGTHPTVYRRMARRRRAIPPRSNP